MNNDNDDDDDDDTSTTTTTNNNSNNSNDMMIIIMIIIIMIMILMMIMMIPVRILRIHKLRISESRFGIPRGHEFPLHEWGVHLCLHLALSVATDGTGTPDPNPRNLVN